MRLLILLVGIALCLPARSQIPGVPIVDPEQPGSVEHVLAIGLLMKKNDCAITFADLMPRLQEAFTVFARTNTKTLSEAQWRALDEKASNAQRAAVPSRPDCEELLSKFGTEDFDTASRDFTREFQSMREAMAVAAKGRGRIGISLDPRSSDARVRDVMANSPAEKCGIRPGDVIVHFDGRPIKKAWELFAAIRSTPPGKKVRLTVVRENASLDLETEVIQSDD